MTGQQEWSQASCGDAHASVNHARFHWLHNCANDAGKILPNRPNGAGKMSSITTCFPIFSLLLAFKVTIKIFLFWFKKQKSQIKTFSIHEILFSTLVRQEMSNAICSAHNDSYPSATWIQLHPENPIAIANWTNICLHHFLCLGWIRDAAFGIHWFTAQATVKELLAWILKWFRFLCNKFPLKKICADIKINNFYQIGRSQSFLPNILQILSKLADHNLFFQIYYKS